MSVPLVEMRGVSKRFGGVHAVAWDPHRGTFAAIGDRRRDGKGLAPPAG